MEKNILPTLSAILLMILGLTSCASNSVSTSEVPRKTSAGTSIQSAFWQGKSAEVWDKLQHVPPSRLAVLQSQTNDPVQRAWIQLTLISKHDSVNTQRLAKDLIAWREQNPSHPANQLLPDNATLTQLQSFAPPKKIAVLLPQNGNYASSGQMVREGFLHSYYVNLAVITVIILYK